MLIFYYTPICIGIVLSLGVGGYSIPAMAKELLANREVSNSVEIVVDMESYVFSPSEITIAPGQPVTLILRNQSFLVPHNFLLEDSQGVRVLEADVSSGDIQTHTLTLKEPGIYPFYCDKQLLFFPSHREEGMEGRLIVQ